MRNVFFFILIFCSFTLGGKCASTLFQKGVEELTQGNYLEAQQYFHEDIEKIPSFSGYYNLGIVAGKLGDWEKAKWAFESALKYNPLNENAQYNATFATHKLNQKKVWENPYGVGKKIIIGFGSVVWVVLAVFFSICTGLFLYVLINKTKKKDLKTRWSQRLIVPFSILFIVSCICIYSIHNHFNQERYAILKNSNTSFYISPNGIEINKKVNPSLRFQIEKHSEDSTWIQLKSPEHNVFWVKNKDIYRF